MRWSSTSKQLRRLTFRAIARHRRSRWATTLAALASSYLSAYGNDDGCCTYDGEVDLLQRLATAGIETVVDVGAHHGDWAIEASRVLGGPSIHACEPAPETAATLRLRVANLPNVRPHEFALGAVTGAATLHFDRDHPQMASLIESAQGTRHEVVVVRGDDFLRTEGIDRVDLLKIDAEGFDLDVLCGFEQAIAEDRVGIIQFEVSRWNAVRRVWIHDFVERLPGYNLGRIFPHYVEPFHYEPEAEDFRFRSNLVAVRDPDLGKLVFGG